MPACNLAAVNEGDVDIGVINQRIGERHSHSTSTDNEVVGCDRSRHPPKASSPGVREFADCWYSGLRLPSVR